MRKRFFLTFLATGLFFLFHGQASFAEEITVQRGDTLWELAQTYGTTVQALQRENKLSTHLIYPNQKLTLTTQKVITVASGDTLWDLARKYHTTVEHLKGINHLSNHLIYPGQKLHFKPNPNENTPTKKDTPERIEGNELTVTATAYTAYCEGCSGTTATGIDLIENPDQKVIAVDPNVIPLGSTVYVEGYGTAIAGDTGGAIKGNKIDVFIPNENEALDWGVRTVKVTLIR